MNGKLTDEAYARAALTYLAEPADRWLGAAVRVHGAAGVLDAIRIGPPARPTGARRAAGAAMKGGHGAMAGAAVRAAGAG